MKVSKILSKYKHIVISIIIIILSLIYVSLDKESKYSIDDNVIEGYIHSYKIDGNKLSIEIKGLETVIGNYYFDTEEEIKSFKNIYHLGDYVKIDCTLNKPKDNGMFNQFSYKEYLSQNNIFFIMKIDNMEKVKDNNRIRYFIKDKIIGRIESIKKSKKYLYAFVIGEEYYINSDVKTSYQKNGISHLFAVSGSNITFVVAIFLKLIERFKYKYVLIFSYVLLYMFLTDFTASIVRSGVFYILITLNKIYKKNFKIVDILFITLSISLIYNPYLLYSVGYQFSFVISAYLILFQDKINKYKSFIGNLFIVSFVAFMSSLPIVLNNFYEFNILSILFNLIYVPFVSFVLFPLSLICFIFPFFDNLLFFLTNLLEITSLFFSKIDILSFILGKPSMLLIIFYYIGITLFLFNKKYIYLIIIILIVNKLMYYNVVPSIEFLDVGQGDSILIRYNKNKTVLIDTGGALKFESGFKRANEFSIGRDSIAPYLKSIGISTIDHMIITHGDEDHIGGAKDIIEEIKVSNIYLNGNFNALEKELLVYNPKVLKEKDVLNVVGNKLFVLNPYKDTDENDSSIVLYLIINNFKILLTGDASTEVEKYIIDNYNLDIDILKVGHHGSKTSTSLNFIKNITPTYGIISVGENNRFGHPNKGVLNTLEEYNVDIYRTDISGSIKFIFKEKLEILTGR